MAVGSLPYNNVQGNIDEARLNAFNIAVYTPSPLELEFLVKKEGYFNVNLVHVFQVSWDCNDYKYGSTLDIASNQYDFTICIRSVLEPLIIAHFGQYIVAVRRASPPLFYIFVSYARVKRNIYFGMS